MKEAEYETYYSDSQDAWKPTGALVKQSEA